MAASRSGAKTQPVTPVPQQLFATIPLATKSEEARKFASWPWTSTKMACWQTRCACPHASEKDPQFALGHARSPSLHAGAFRTRRLWQKPNPCSLAHYPTSGSWSAGLTSDQDRDLLPAIMNMNVC